jgi:type I restriction enzyme S subunit
MEVKPGYKRTEVGVIPEGWGQDRIKNLASIGTGARDTQDKVDDGEYPFFVRSASVERINSYSFDGEAVLTAGDGVGTGKIFHYIDGRFDFHQRVYKISDFATDLDGYFFYLYFSTHFYNRVMSMTAKSSVDSVRMEMIADMEVPLPPLPEQQAIAEVLSDVDALIAALDRLIAKKRAIKQGAMEQLLTGKTRLPGFTGKWEVRTIGEAFQFLQTASNSRSDLTRDGSVKYIHYGDIHTKWDTFLDCDRGDVPRIREDRLPRVPFLEDGDLVMADASEDHEGIGASIEVRNATGRRVVAGLHTLLLRGDKNMVADGFKGYIQYIPAFKRALIRVATGISVYGISKSKTREISIELPTVPEQKAVAAVLSDMDAEITALEARRDKTRALKKGMMQELLTGRTRLI